MSGSGRKRGPKWDSKEDTHRHHSNSASYYRDKDPRFNGSRRSTAADDQHTTQARTRSRVAQNNEYYSELDENRQQFYHRSGSSSRSRSPVYRSRRDTGSYDRHNKTRTRVSSQEFNKRGGSDYGWEDKVRNSRETEYYTDDFREQVMKKGVRSRSFDYNTDDGASDPRLTRHRNELTEEKDIQTRDGDGEGEFRRSSNIPCKFFAAGFCRNGKHCRFSHHGGAERKQPQDNNFYRHDNNNHIGRNKWNDVERLDNGKFGEMEVSRAQPKGNGSSWIDNMEMSPDWNYSAQSLKNPVKEEHGVGILDQSSQALVLKDNMATKFEQKSSGMLSYGEKPIDASHNNPVNIAPVQAFNHNALLYQSSLTTGGSQQVVAAAAGADFPLGSNLSNPENGKVYQDSIVEKTVPVQNTVTREQINQISSISASIAQFLANGQPIPQLQHALQMTLHSESSMAVQPNQATMALSNNPNQVWGLGASTGGEGVPAVTVSQVISNIDKSQELAGNPKAFEENGDKKTDEASKKEEESKKTGEDTNDAENVVDEDEDDEESDEENKKGKDPKGMRVFKFALVEIVKELLKPAWKEGKMNKDGYKNIVKKVVEKVTGTMQSGNVPQTQEKIDHYLSASKPKLTKLVQAYISKVKKS